MCFARPLVGIKTSNHKTAVSINYSTSNGIATMNTSQLEELNSGYIELFGEAVEHFVCPILFADEETELCDGHVVSKSLGGSNRTIIQRADVDRFFGKIERNFALEQKKRASSNIENLKNHNSSIELGEQTVTHYQPKSKDIPTGHTAFVFEEEPSEVFLLRLPSDEIRKAIANGENLSLTTTYGNLGSISAVLFHSTHLTMFRLLKYRYAYSTSGVETARILRHFYEDNKKSDSQQIRENAESYFEEHENYIQHMSSLDFLRGTVDDGWFLAWVGSSNIDLAYGVFIKTKRSLFLVWIMSDVSINHNAVESYLNLANGFPSQMKLNWCQIQPTDFGDCRINRCYKPLNVVWEATPGVGIQF